jgi:hypothetical protein
VFILTAALSYTNDGHCVSMHTSAGRNPAQIPYVLWSLWSQQMVLHLAIQPVLEPNNMVLLPLTHCNHSTVELHIGIADFINFIVNVGFFAHFNNIGMLGTV